MRILTVILSLTLAVSAQTKPADTAADHLPIKRVVLYKNGVGYFEHVGKVHGTQDVNIDFTTSQLDDVLKSLTIVDYGDGRVTGVRYNSTAPLDQRLRGLRIPLGENPTREQLLNALRGARVEVRNGTASSSGKILSVETRTRENSRTDEKISVTELSIITDTGELRTFELNTGTSVRIADRDLNLELARYMNVIGSSRAKDVRRMTLSASGTGERDLFVSYVSEVPIWKTTYRIIIPPDPKAAAAAGLGRRRQHHRRGLERRKTLARRRRTPKFRAADFDTLLRSSPGNRSPRNRTTLPANARSGTNG